MAKSFASRAVKAPSTPIQFQGPMMRWRWNHDSWASIH
uniref:Uncharacterized protein n=1 Tax=Rhizophora mucronata TaxID=61149 RepID=A0A2P2ITS7_RHIMU